MTKKNDERDWRTVYAGEPGEQPPGTREYSVSVSFTDFSRLNICFIYAKNRATALMTGLARVADCFNDIREIDVLDITEYKLNNP